MNYKILTYLDNLSEKPFDTQTREFLLHYWCDLSKDQYLSLVGRSISFSYRTDPTVVLQHLNFMTDLFTEHNAIHPLAWEKRPSYMSAEKCEFMNAHLANIGARHIEPFMPTLSTLAPSTGFLQALQAKQEQQEYFDAHFPAALSRLIKAMDISTDELQRWYQSALQPLSAYSNISERKRESAERLLGWIVVGPAIGIDPLAPFTLSHPQIARPVPINPIDIISRDEMFTPCWMYLKAQGAPVLAPTQELTLARIQSACAPMRKASTHNLAPFESACVNLYMLFNAMNLNFSRANTERGKPWALTVLAQMGDLTKEKIALFGKHQLYFGPQTLSLWAPTFLHQWRKLGSFGNSPYKTQQMEVLCHLASNLGLGKFAHWAPIIKEIATDTDTHAFIAQAALSSGWTFKDLCTLRTESFWVPSPALLTLKEHFEIQETLSSQSLVSSEHTPMNSPIAPRRTSRL